MAQAGRSSTSEPRGFLDGQLLVAMPGMEDSRFAGSVIYICAHSSDGAMGLIINQPSDQIAFPELLRQVKLIEDGQTSDLPDAVAAIRVLNGGPVERSRGFVLHTNDYFLDHSSLPVDDGIAMTITIDILKAIADGSGPERAVVALGYAGWSPGQLEAEIQANSWLHVPADPALIFDPDHATKYQRAMKSIGIDPRMLSSEAGHG